MKLYLRVLETTFRSTILALLWVGIWALFGDTEQDELVLAGIVSFAAYWLGFWHGRYP